MVILMGCTRPGEHTNIAMENGPVEIVDFPMKNGGSFHCYVSSPEGIHITHIYIYSVQCGAP